MNIKTKIEKAILKANRQRQINDGFFDGRFRTKVQDDQKKKISKNFCRSSYKFQ